MPEASLPAELVAISLLTVALWMGGCRGQPSTQSSPGPAPPDPCPSQPVQTSCDPNACIGSGGRSCVEPWECKDADLCPQVVFYTDMTAPDNPAAAQCTLAALRDGKVGHVGWAVDPGAPFNRFYDLHIRPGRVALYNDALSADLAGDTFHVSGPAAIKEANYFQTCLGSGTDNLGCLAGWKAGCAP